MIQAGWAEKHNLISSASCFGTTIHPNCVIPTGVVQSEICWGVLESPVIIRSQAIDNFQATVERAAHNE